MKKEFAQNKKHAVATHWGKGHDMATAVKDMLDALDVDNAGTIDEKLSLIAEIDHFHGGSAETTEIVREKMDLPKTPNLRGIDVGCGVGGPMRWFAHKTGAQMVGV